LLRVTQGRPMVTLKLASSFDGRIATASGESRWITGGEARRAVHAMRSRHDAVLIGGGTARADDPDLTVRGLGDVGQPVRVVASRHLTLPDDGRLATTAREVPVWLIHGDKPDDVAPVRREVWEARGATLIPAPVAPGGDLDPRGLLQALGAAGLTRVLCEGGGALAASLLAADCVDRITGFTAGLALGAEGYPSIGALGIGHLADAPRFRLIAAREVGGDVVHDWVRI
jgi:diaminohydroxyphosphoribosylaminopyrimidine deaminase/5-amino-6-(5-phosphoribosylamino)uracil reductase